MISKQALIDICKVINKTLRTHLKIRKFYSQKDLEDIAQNWSDSLCNVVIHDIHSIINNNIYDIWDNSIDPFCLKSSIECNSNQCASCHYDRYHIRCKQYETIYKRLEKTNYKQICDLPGIIDSILDITEQVYKPRNYKQIIEDKMSYDISIGYLFWFNFGSIKTMVGSLVDKVRQNFNESEISNIERFILLHYDLIITQFKDELNQVILKECKPIEI